MQAMEVVAMWVTHAPWNYPKQLCRCFRLILGCYGPGYMGLGGGLRHGKVHGVLKMFSNY